MEEDLDKVPFIAWNHKNEKINTEHGIVRYEQFCINEVKRMQSNKKVRRKGDLVCVY